LYIVIHKTDQIILFLRILNWKFMNVKICVIRSYWL